MKVVKNKFREKDEVETYFSDAKRKSFPFVMILILLIITIIGGLAYYYFILDNPKNIFLAIVNEVSEELLESNDEEKASVDFEIDINTFSNKKEYVELTNIIDKISLNGTFGYNNYQKEASLGINAQYEDKNLFGLTTYYYQDNLYLKLNNIYDKVLKLKLTEEEQKSFNKMFTEESKKEDILLIKSFNKHLRTFFKNGEYQKEYVKVEHLLVKKLTFVSSKENTKKLFDNLLNDEEFLKYYSSYEEITKEELIDSLKELQEKLTKSEIEISLYLSIIENEFIKGEAIYDETKIIINKVNNEIQYKYYEESIIKYQGFIMIKENDDNLKIDFSIEDIEEEITLEISADLNLDLNKEIEKLDTTNAKDIDSLTENDYLEIQNNIAKNEVLNKLVEDIIGIFIINSDSIEEAA